MPVAHSLKELTLFLGGFAPARAWIVCISINNTQPQTCASMHGFDFGAGPPAWRPVAICRVRCRRYLRVLGSQRKQQHEHAASRRFLRFPLREPFNGRPRGDVIGRQKSANSISQVPLRHLTVFDCWLGNGQVCSDSIECLLPVFEIIRRHCRWSCFATCRRRVSTHARIAQTPAPVLSSLFEQHSPSPPRTVRIQWGRGAFFFSFTSFL